MNNLQLCKTLINVWNQDYETLYDILNSEQLALEKRDFEALQKIVTEKNQMVSKINQHEIPPMIISMGKSITTMNQFKNYCLQNTDLVPVWQNLMQLVEKCCLKNEVNARLIELVTNSSQRTFNLIKGFDPDNNIYNAKGNRTTVRYYGDSLSA